QARARTAHPHRESRRRRLGRSGAAPSGPCRTRPPDGILRVSGRSGGARLVAGADVGGTFTDLFLFDEASGTARVAKVPSTRGRESVGFAEGLAGLAPLAELSAIVHGTTVGTNALLERKGAPAGLITTAGFRDVLEMR